MNDRVILHGLEMPSIMQIEPPRNENANHDKKQLLVRCIEKNNLDWQRVLREESRIASLHQRQKNNTRNGNNRRVPVESTNLHERME